MPVSLVKSLSSSTSAFAGSHAAQHIVSDLPSACAEDAAPRVSARAPAAHTRDRVVLLILIVRSSYLAGHRRPSLNPRVGRDFRVFTRPGGKNETYQSLGSPVGRSLPGTIQSLVMHQSLSRSTKFSHTASSGSRTTRKRQWWRRLPMPLPPQRRPPRQAAPD